MKKLYRSSNEKIVAGVCGGISAYFKINVDLVRIIMSAVILFVPYGWMVYFIPAVFLGEKKSA